MCDSLRIVPKPNNGTLRLPLKPIGLHSDKPSSSEEDHPDFTAEIFRTDDPVTEANETKLADAPLESDVDVDGAHASDTTPMAPVETVLIVETASPEGMANEAT